MMIIICNVPNGEPAQHGTTRFLILVLTLNNTLDTAIIETECLLERVTPVEEKGSQTNIYTPFCGYNYTQRTAKARKRN